MANTKIWDLSNVSSPAGTERIPVATGSSSGNNGYISVDGLGSVPKTLTAAVYSLGTPQTISFNGTIQTLNSVWTNVEWNYGNLWDGSNKKFTAPFSGIWQITCKVQVDRASGASMGEVFLNVNAASNGSSGENIGWVTSAISTGSRWFLNANGLMRLYSGESAYALMLGSFGGTGVLSNCKWDINLVYRI